MDIRKILLKLAHSSEYCSSSPFPFKGYLLVSVQHILNTTVDMLSVMKQLGLEDAIIAGKSYSTHLPNVKKITDELQYYFVEEVEQLGFGHFDDSMRMTVHNVWLKAIELLSSKDYKGVIILDDGSDLLRATPAKIFKNKSLKIVGIEQTKGGIIHTGFNGLPFPIINVAESKVKKVLEYPFVSKNIVNKVNHYIDGRFIKQKKSMVIGVFGYGDMGKSICECLITQKYKVIVHEKDISKINFNHPNLIFVDQGSVMASNADVIISCTGQDVTAENSVLSALRFSRTQKTLISSSSKDYEFNTFLRHIQSKTKMLGVIPDPLKDIRYQNIMGAVIDIAHGGFPINFTNGPHSILPEYIWPTRAALLFGCLMGVRLTILQNNQLSISLDEVAQEMILNQFFQLNPDLIKQSPWRAFHDTYYTREKITGTVNAATR